MKVFISAIISLALITGFVVFSSVHAQTVSDAMLEQTEKLVSHVTESEDADADLEIIGKIREIWEDERFVLSLGVSHREIDEIDLSVCSLEAALRAGDRGNVSDAAALLRERLILLKYSESFSPDGIV